MESRWIKVGMGQGVVAGKHTVLSSLGVGSCVVVALYDHTKRVGAMAHVMLPDSGLVKNKAGDFQCADTAVKSLVSQLCLRGARRECIVAKIAGGARMFLPRDDEPSGIGERNVRRIKEILAQEGIKLAASDVCCEHGRNVHFYLDSGKIVVSSLGQEDKHL